MILGLIGWDGILVWAQEKADDIQNSVTADETSRLELEEIVVTASRIEEPIKSIPRNVTVITSEDIEQAPSNNIVDLLNREAGINLRSLFGNDKQAVIDIRGMGATAASNVVVMLDGIRMNSPDLSGVDFSAIPLEQIERIEIVRGAGSVNYGDGSVGGVINIVTKKGDPGMNTKVYASYGSFDALDTRASLNGSMHDLSLNLHAGYYDAQGYRDNGELLKKDMSGGLSYDFSDVISLNMSGGFHEDTYGLPGPVSKADIDSEEDRVKTDYPDDYGGTVDMRINGGLEIDTETWGSFKLIRGYRLRNNDYIVGYSPLISDDEQTAEIEMFTKMLTVLYDKDFILLNREHAVQLGIDHYFTDYVREEAPNGPRQNSQMENMGVFINTGWTLTDQLKANLGYRENRCQGKFRTDQLVSFGDKQRWVNGETEDLDWQNNALDLGLIYNILPSVTFYANYGTQFRIPNVDELAESEEGLKPQEGYQWETGGRFEISSRTELSVALFHISIEDEIYYSEINRNYDDVTVRNGIESDVKFYITDALFTWANYSYTEAKFEGSGAFVPLVPKHKGSMGLEWSAFKDTTFSMTGTYVGSRYDGNDVDNERYEKLEAYTVFDGKATYERGGFKLFAGVNNILDEMYSTSSYSERYYPMPGRNVYGGLEWAF